MMHTKCELCSQSISIGEPYGVLVFNIEKLSVTPKYPNGCIDVMSSEEVNTMCMNCAKQYNGDSVKSLLD